MATDAFRRFGSLTSALMLMMPDVSLPAFLFASDIGAAHLPLALLLVFGTAKLLAEVCERLGQPGIVGEILAGVLLGPSVLHLVSPDAVLTALAEMGVLFLLFRVGLEVKASALLRLGGTALWVATLGVVLPFVAGWALMAAAGVSRVEAIFVGSAMVATSVGITAQCSPPKGCLRSARARSSLAPKTCPKPLRHVYSD